MPAADQHVLIVGAGVTGLLTAIACARAGHRVTVLDRGPIPNPGSTSFDQHRALRALDPGDREATERGARLHREWRDLEALLRTRLYRRVGVVTAWPAGRAVAVASAGADAGLPVEIVDPVTLPHVRFPADHLGVRESDAGVLLADRVLHAAVRWLATRDAVRLRPGTEVTGVNVDSGHVLLGGGRRLGADRIVLAAGPWLPGLIDVPTILHRQAMVYLRPPERLTRWWATAPSAGRIGADGVSWLVPPGDGTQLKISSDTICHQVAALDTPLAAAFDPRALAASILTDADAYRVDHVKECHYLVDAASGGAQLTRVGGSVWAHLSGGDGFRTAPLIAAELRDATPVAPNRKEHP